MMPKLIYKEKKDEPLVCKNMHIRICTVCGDDRIESFEFGISCEECGSLLVRSKC